MEFFYAPSGDVHGDVVVLRGEEFTHLTHVMRRKAGDRIVITDGAGRTYTAEIADTSRREAVCRIIARQEFLHEPRVHITLAVALLKNPAKFDFLVEKATELGVSVIVPLRTERTIPAQGRTDRWQKLALAAMKQSMRCVLPEVRPVVAFEDVVRNTGAAARIIPHEQGTAPRIPELQLVRSADSIAICIGPEGGFTDSEVRRAVDAGFVPVSLGKTRLRTETAAIAAVATVIAIDTPIS